MPPRCSRERAGAATRDFARAGTACKCNMRPCAGSAPASGSTFNGFDVAANNATFDVMTLTGNRRIDGSAITTQRRVSAA